MYILSKFSFKKALSCNAYIDKYVASWGDLEKKAVHIHVTEDITKDIIARNFFPGFLGVTSRSR